MEMTYNDMVNASCNGIKILWNTDILQHSQTYTAYTITRLLLSLYNVVCLPYFNKDKIQAIQGSATLSVAGAFTKCHPTMYVGRWTAQLAIAT